MDEYLFLRASETKLCNASGMIYDAEVRLKHITKNKSNNKSHFEEFFPMSTAFNCVQNTIFNNAAMQGRVSAELHAMAPDLRENHGPAYVAMCNQDLILRLWLSG